MPLQKLPDKTPKTLTDDESRQAMAALGKRLAYLVALAPLTDEARAEIVQTVPFMSFAQLDDLAKMLEAGIREAGGDPNATDASAKLDAAAEEFADKTAAIDEQADAQLDDIEKELKDAEQK